MKFLERDEVQQDADMHDSACIELEGKRCAQLGMLRTCPLQETFGQVLLEPFEKLMKSKSASADVKAQACATMRKLMQAHECSQCS